MLKIRLLYKESCLDNLFVYPCKDPNNKPLVNRTVSIIDAKNLIDKEWLESLGAVVLMNSEIENSANTIIAIVGPKYATTSGEESYYEVLDYYIELLQKLVLSMKDKHNFKHIIVLLPPHSDEYSTSYDYMAYYAVYGLIQGLGKMYAANTLYVNGIILNERDNQMNLKERIQYLACDNSCNTVGQIFKL